MPKEYTGYKNPVIYRNFRFARIAGAVSSILSLSTAILWINVLIKLPSYYPLPLLSFSLDYSLLINCLYYFILLCSPFYLSVFPFHGNNLTVSTHPAHRDVRSIKTLQLTCSLPFIALFITKMISDFLLLDPIYVNDFAGKLGACYGGVLIPHIPFHIGCFFLSRNKKLIMNETIWVKEEEQRQENKKTHKENQANERIKQQKKSQEEKQIKKTVFLLSECGFKYFLKYYKQIASLPMRDIDIQENYSLKEKEIRYIAAKKILNQGLTKIAAKIILSKKTLLTPKEVDLAKSILNNRQ